MTKPEIVYLPIEKPPEGRKIPGWIPIAAADGHTFDALRVLGHPVPALPDALSPQARAVLEAAVRWRRAGCPNGWQSADLVAIDAYAATLAPPDPLREAREALEDMLNSGDSNGSVLAAGRRLSAALDRLAEKGGAA